MSSSLDTTSTSIYTNCITRLTVKYLHYKLQYNECTCSIVITELPLPDGLRTVY